VGNLEDATSVAPGADDDASGAAALLELCRVLSARQWEATIRFVAFAAKETGLHGSEHHATAAARVGIPVVGVFNNDIIGSARGPGGTSDPSSVRVFSADDDEGTSRALARYLHRIGERYGGPAVHVVEEPDRPGREGDHLSFSNAGFPAVRIVAGLEDPTRQHNDRDTADRLDAAYHAAVVRLNIAAVANLALAPRAPSAPVLSVSTTEPDALMVSWDAAEGSRVAGYFVAVRSTAQPHYDRVEWVGPATEHVLGGIVPEDVAVAVAASDDMGHTSLFSPEAAP
jgi:Zn-dependent M28 family amino/carboxypeptidase